MFLKNSTGSAPWGVRRSSDQARHVEFKKTNYFAKVSIIKLRNVTALLNVCYNFIKTIDIIQKKDKIVIYEWKVTL